MELRDLSYFVAVAETASFTRAAARTNVVQSTLSVAVARLERELGQSLFHRTPRGITLTRAGELTLTRARALLAAERLLHAELTALDGGLVGAVTIGTGLTTGNFDLASTLRRLRDTHPLVEVRVKFLPTVEERLDRLVDGTVDLAFIPEPITLPGGVRVDRVGNLALALVTGYASAVPHRRLSFDDLSAIPYVDFPCTWTIRTVIDELFAKHNIRRDVAIEVSECTMAIELVRGGFGAAFLPRWMVERRSDLRAVEHDLKTPILPLLLARSKQPQPPLIEAIHAALRSAS